MFLRLQLLFSPDDGFGGSSSSQSDLDILNEETPEETASTEEVVEEKPVETESVEAPESEEPGEVVFDESVEEEEKPEPKVPDEPDDQEVPEGQLRFKDVKSKYPTIFKEFPPLAQALRNDRAYGEIFSSPDDAKEAAQTAGYFRKLQETLIEGSPATLLQELEEGNPEAYKKVVRDFLPTVKSKSMELFAEITLPAVNDVLRSAIRDAEGSDNINLRNAALHIAKYLYGKPEIPDLTPKKTEPNPEEQRLQNERKAFWQEKAADFTNECYSVGREETLTEISKGIDSDNSISPFLKKTLKDAIFTEVDSLLAKDPRHIRQMNALWRKAESTGFQKEARREIINAYLRGAKVLIPSIRQKLRAEAGVQGKQPQPTPKRTNIPASGRKVPTTQAAKLPSARDVNWNKTSDLAFLNGRYTPKRKT